jgi:hypothetical protein
MGWIVLPVAASATTRGQRGRAIPASSSTDAANATDSTSSTDAACSTNSADSTSPT